MIMPYIVAVCQSEVIANRSGGDDKIPENTRKNRKRYCDLIDYVFSGSGTRHGVLRPRLVTFGEFSLTGMYSGCEAGQKAFNRSEIIKHLAIRIPGEETEMLARKAREHDTYIAAANLEFDPAYPDLFFNCGFIVNPKGKVILKYRKTVTNNTAEMSASVHDVMDGYKNPITGTYDPFPVVDTEIGRLAVMVCADGLAPEIPRVYSMKGAEVILHLTTSGTYSPPIGGPIGAIENYMRARAFDNCIYWVESNFGPVLGGFFPRGIMDGYSRVYDYRGDTLARAEDTNEYVVKAVIDVEACRRYREAYFVNKLTLIRTELYAPYYSKPIYPANTALKDGPPDEHVDARQQKWFNQARENLKKCQDFYSEGAVP